MTDIGDLKKSPLVIGRDTVEDFNEKESKGIGRGKSVPDTEAKPEGIVEAKKQIVKEVPALTSVKQATGGVKQLSIAVKSEEPASEMAETESVDIESMDYTSPRDDLQIWRNIRDSSQIMYDQYIGSTKKGTVSFRAEKIEIDSTELSEIKSLEKNLIEAYYNIGLLTDDPDELQNTIRFLENYIEREGASYPEEAGKYLERLKSMKSD